MKQVNEPEGSPFEAYKLIFLCDLEPNAMIVCLEKDSRKFETVQSCFFINMSSYSKSPSSSQPGYLAVRPDWAIFDKETTIFVYY